MNLPILNTPFANIVVNPHRSVGRTDSKLRRLLVAGLALGLGPAIGAIGADFNVTSPGFFYSFNGTGNNPTITVIRGETYTFAVSTALSHPFQITGAGANDVLNNNISSGTITFKVPTNAASYFYRCSIHGFSGQILTVPPPVVRITRLDLGPSSLVLHSTGTNTYQLFPEFSTNLVATNWFALTVRSNRFMAGTNETFCGRPPDTNAYIRLRAQRN